MEETTKPDEQTNVVKLEKSKKPRKPKVPKPTKAAKKVAKSIKHKAAPCACQCGEEAKGGGFIPGHDSKLAGAIKRVIAGKPYEGERAYVAKVAKSEHPALASEHFVKLLKAVR